MDFNTVKEYESYLLDHYKEQVAYRFRHHNGIKEITYGEFVGKAEGIAKILRAAGFQRENIAIIGNTSFEWFNSYIGILASNNIVVSMDPRLMPKQKEAILNDTQTKVVFYSNLEETQKNGIRNHCKSVERLYDMKQIVSQVNELPVMDDKLEDKNQIGQYMYTSGTTGDSKAVMLSNQNILSVINFHNMDIFKLGEIYLSVLSIHHCYELSCHLSALKNGCTICINDGYENLIKNMKYFKPDITGVVPVFLEEILRQYREWMKIEEMPFHKGVMTKEELERFHAEFGGELDTIICGGTAMRPELVDQLAYFGIKVVFGYGMTEMCGHTTLNMHTVEKPKSVGIPFRTDLSLKIDDDGEILVKGPNLMIGYRNGDNQNIFTQDGYFRTGDLGYLDEDGYLYLTGRKKDVIILNNGENVYPEELELYLANFSGVIQVIVFPYENQIAASFYLAAPDAKEQVENQLREFNSKLATYKRITRVFYRDVPFITTSTGKIKRSAFMEELEHHKTEDFVPLETETEQLIGSVIKEILSLDREPGAFDNFFTLGVNSLNALAVAAKINVTAQEIYENPCIRNLAKAMDEKIETPDYDESFVNQLIAYNKNIEYSQRISGILLTGATGFFGAHILHQLIHEKNTEMYCLVRTRGKLAKVYKKYFGEDLPKNIHEVIGDIEEEKLKLSSKRYQQLAKSVDTVIHAAANVHHLGERNQFVKTNYSGTLHMIEFCKKAGAVLHYVSSYASSGISVVPIHSGIEAFDENVLFIGQEYYKNVYVYTKYLSEKKILEERKNGLHANIYRIGSLTSRRSDGMFQLNPEENGLRNRLRGIIKTGAYTEGVQSYLIDFTAVDECADAFVRLVYGGKINNIYHVFNPNAITIKDVGLIGGKQLHKVSDTSFDLIIKRNIDDIDISEYGFYTAMSASSKPVRIQCAITYLELNRLRFQWGVNTIEYISNFIDINEKN